MSQIFEYDTVKKESTGDFQSRGSKFYAYVFPMQGVGDLDQRIQLLKKEHPKARHYCYAYRVLLSGELREFSSDAGEPGGSAGPPILGALSSASLLNAGAVVVRYFGGTKLGVPGLIEAYRDSTLDAIDKNTIVRIERTIDFRLELPMRLQPMLMEMSKKLNITTSNHTYTDTFATDIEIPLKDNERILLRLLKLLSGRDYQSTKEYLEFLGGRMSEL